jgi:hypothetical protein
MTVLKLLLGFVLWIFVAKIFMWIGKRLWDNSKGLD